MTEPAPPEPDTPGPENPGPENPGPANPGPELPGAGGGADRPHGYQSVAMLLVPWRTILRALAISAVLHALAMAVVYIGGQLAGDTSIRFSESRGVALLSSVGQRPSRYEELDVTIEDLDHELVDPSADAEGGEDPPDAELTEGEEPDPTLAGEDTEPAVDGGAGAPDEATEDGDVVEPAGPTPEELAELAAAEEALRQAEARRRRREREREAERVEQARIAEEQRQLDEAARIAELRRTDPMALPPAQRHPEGTLNPIATDVGMWGPEGAQLVVILRNDRLRRSPHRESAQRLLRAFPDWRSLLGGAPLDPLEDIDTLLIASSDPRYINRTFLAAVHRIPPHELVEALSLHGLGGVDWEDQRGRLMGRPRRTRGIDPRVFYIPTENLFLYSRPEYVPDLQRNLPTARGLDRALEQAIGSGDDEAGANGSGQTGSGQAGAGVAPGAEPGAAGADTPGAAGGDRAPGATAGSGGGSGAGAAAADASRPQTVVRTRLRAVRADDEPPLRADGWVRGLTQLADFGGAATDGPAIVITTGTLAQFRIDGMGGVTPPTALHASVMATANPEVQGRMQFGTAREAQAFIDRWPAILSSNRAALTLTGLYRPLSEARWETDYNEAVFRFTIEQATVRRLVATVSQVMQTR